MDPELPRLVVRRCHDAATARIAADDEGLRPERRVLELLHGGEERVEIEVRDDHAPSVTGGAVVADGPSPVSLRRRRHCRRFKRLGREDLTLRSLQVRRFVRWTRTKYAPPTRATTTSTVQNTGRSLSQCQWKFSPRPVCSGVGTDGDGKPQG